jgi:glucan 1,3-beta-glucosidase
MVQNGINWIRLPVPFWMSQYMSVRPFGQTCADCKQKVETWPGEPHLEGVAWSYFLRALAWSRKYGIRVHLDLHSVPGSQNGWNHSGKDGQIGFLSGVMVSLQQVARLDSATTRADASSCAKGIVNAERTLNYIAALTRFVSQPEYKNVV